MIKLTNLILEQKGSEFVIDTHTPYTGKNTWAIKEFNGIKTIVNGVEAEKKLKELGAKAFVYTGNEEELPSYLLKVYRYKKLHYVLTFLSDGQVLSQQYPNYTFKYDNGIALYTEDGSKHIGMIEKDGNQAVLKLTTEFEAKEKTITQQRADVAAKETGEETWTASDWGHAALGIAGFIPGYGDAIDIIDAAWYFIEGKYFDGFLSLIAVVPFVGSAIKASVKAGMAAFPGMIKLAKAAFKNPDAAAEFWKLCKKNDILTPSQLESVAEFMGDTAKWITKNKSGVIGKLRTMSANTMDPTTINAALKNLEDFLSHSAESIDTLTKTANAPSKLRPGIRMAAKVKGETLANITKSLMSLGFFKPANLDRMSKVLSWRFAKQITSDPAQLNALIRAMPDAKLFKSKLNKIKAVASANIKNEPFLKKRFDNLDVDNIELFKRDFPQVYEKMANEAVDFAQKNKNYFWLKFEDDSLNRVGSLLSTGWFGPEGLSIWKEIKQNFWRKSANLIGNEAENVKEYLYPETIDGSPDAIIGPAIKKLMRDYLSPETNQAVKAVAGKIVKPAVRGGAAAAGVAPTPDPYVAPKPLINLD
jgi:hypothetical protein